MKIAVLGSGVIGITSAWYLAAAGHEVVVVDRRPGPALETSFANAGQISPGYASPWAAPGIPAKAIRWLFRKDAPLVLRFRADMALMRWLAAMLRNCTAARYQLNKGRMVRLAEFSRTRLDDLRQSTGIFYDQRQQGTLQLFREQHQLDSVGKDMAILAADGVPFELLGRDGCIRAEPALTNSRVTFAGGLRLPRDETGDCYEFTSALAAMAKARGVIFVFDRTITSLVEEKGRITAVATQQGSIAADAYLVALGSYSPLLLAPLGIRLPVYPVKGYSLTATIDDRERAPVSTVLDESYKVAITRLGDRIRIGGMAEIGGYNYDLPVARRRTLARSASTLFPDAADLDGATFWSGLRPMTPDSTPVIGPTNVPNLFLNTGHGTLGWTMACGSGQVIADIMSGRTPAIKSDDLALSRY